MTKSLKKIKYALYKYSTENIGDEIQSIAARRFLPQVDYYIDRDRIGEWKNANQDETVKLIANGWYMRDPFMWPPTDKTLNPLLISMYVEPKQVGNQGVIPRNIFLTNNSKRYLKKLVEEGDVDGWDDPRLVSIAALRRRGFTPESIKMFIDLCGVSKAQSSVDYAMLEYCIREDLKMKKPRMMAVLDPIRLVIDNYPEDQVEYLDVANNLENEELGSRKVPFGRELFIEREDFMEEPPKKYFRLFPGNEVRLMHAYFVKCTGFEKDENGNITVVHCTYDPETKAGSGFTGRKVKGTIHWVPADYAQKAEVRLYENLVDEEKGVYNKEDGSLNLNPNSLTVIKDALVEPSFEGYGAYDSFQFVRNGYFCIDAHDSTPEHLVFNRIVSLKSSFRLPQK